MEKRRLWYSSSTQGRSPGIGRTKALSREILGSEYMKHSYNLPEAERVRAWPCYFTASNWCSIKRNLHGLRKISRLNYGLEVISKPPNHGLQKLFRIHKKYPRRPENLLQCNINKNFTHSIILQYITFRAKKKSAYLQGVHFAKQILIGVPLDGILFSVTKSTMNIRNNPC